MPNPLFASTIPIDPLDIFCVAWFTMAGAMIGSFVNVVVYRLPRGIGLARRGSHCQHAVRVYDNIPVVSYLMLGGRCRDCGGPIAPRYPLVEALFASLFFIVALLEGASDLGNLPGIPAHFRPTNPLWPVWALVTVHLVLLATLLCAAVMEQAGETVPRQLFWPSLFLLGPLLTALPTLRPVPAALALAHLPPPWTGVVDSLFGLAVGGGLGLLTWRTAARRLPPAWPPLSTLAGVTLGWQATCLVVGMSLVVLAGLSAAGTIRPRRSYAVAFTATFTLIIAWRPLYASLPLLHETAGSLDLALLVLPSLAAAAILRKTLRPMPQVAAVRPAPVVPLSADCHPPMSNDHSAAIEAILHSPSYRLPEEDTDFMKRPALRPVRLQLELLKPEILLEEHGIRSTIVVFGGTQIIESHEAQKRVQSLQQALREAPHNAGLQRSLERAERILAKSHYYDAAREFARIVCSACRHDGQGDFVITTGGGPGIMEAANRGAHDAGSRSIGLNITLPHEQLPNPYITPELCFQFHYFALRKMHFLLRAKALVIFPGGFGTLDELFDALTLRQTNRMQEIPIVLYGRSYWREIIHFERLADEGVIADEHLDLITYADSPREAWEAIAGFCGIDPDDPCACGVE